MPVVTGWNVARVALDDEHAGAVAGVRGDAVARWRAHAAAARSTTDCSGTVRTFFRSSVRISASQVRPGRSDGVGARRAARRPGTRARRPACRRRAARSRRSRRPCPGSVRPGMASSTTSAVWPSASRSTSASATFTSASIVAEVGDGHQRRARLVLDADDDHLALAHLQARHDAVDGRRDLGLARRRRGRASACARAWATRCDGGGLRALGALQRGPADVDLGRAPRRRPPAPRRGPPAGRAPRRAAPSRAPGWRSASRSAPRPRRRRPARRASASPAAPVSAC